VISENRQSTDVRFGNVYRSVYSGVGGYYWRRW